LETKVDPIKVERAEKEIDRFISTRSEAKKKANAESLAYEASLKKREHERREQNRLGWLEHDRRLLRHYQRCVSEMEERIEKLKAQRETED